MENLPSVFFKYQSRGAARAVLTGRTLRWSTPATLNDPFDIQFDLATKVDNDLVCRLALDKLWRCYIGEVIPALYPGNLMAPAILLLRASGLNLSRSEFVAKMEPGIRAGLAGGDQRIADTLAESRQLMSTTKILCLSDSGDNILLWSHYAELHQGACLMFAAIPNSPYTLARPIQYVTEVPNLFDEELLSDIFSGLRTIDTRAAMDKMIYTKSQHWSYEREWRVFAGDGRTKDAPYEDCPFGAEELVGVVLGARMSPDERTEFSELVKGVNPLARVYNAHLASGFGISLVEA